MIVNIYGGKKQVICDSCGDGFDAEDFEDARAIMKEEGWRSIKIGDIWENYCLHCRKEVDE